MTAEAAGIGYRRLRAPADDATALIEPPLSEIGQVLTRNREFSRRHSLDLEGRPLAELVVSGRQELLAKAIDYTRQYRPVSWASSIPQTSPFILSGHQPTLFHPGVWLKNFLLSTLASHVGGIPINLIVDNDMLREVTIRVPVSTATGASVMSVEMDAGSEEAPYESRPIMERAQFDTFGERLLRELGAGPASSVALIRQLWPFAVQAANRQSPQPALLGRCLAEARHRLEGELDLRTLEVPLSSVAETPSFHYFVAYLLRHLPKLFGVYNESLADYRRANRIRSHAHPVPELAKDGEWLEAPLWFMPLGQRNRDRPYFQANGTGTEFRVAGGATHRLEIAGPITTGGIANALQVASLQGVLLRPRALITTMYARLVLSDLFIHGIGGAKYDELTDAIIRRFFGLKPPEFVTATATVRLPIVRPPATLRDLRQLNRRIRDTIHSPESFAETYIGEHASEFRSLAARKRELIAEGWQKNEKPAWHDQVEKCNQRMTDLLASHHQQLHSQRERLLSDLHSARLLGSREFSFCLFSEEHLVPILQKLTTM